MLGEVERVEQGRLGWYDEVVGMVGGGRCLIGRRLYRVVWMAWVWEKRDTGSEGEESRTAGEEGMYR